MRRPKTIEERATEIGEEIEAEMREVAWQRLWAERAREDRRRIRRQGRMILALVLAWCLISALAIAGLYW